MPSVVIVQTNAVCDALLAMLFVPIAMTAALMCLLLVMGRFSDAFLCLLSCVLYRICTREKGQCNFSFVVLLFVMSCFQFFFSSLRLLLLLSGTAEEMAPQESESLFAAFAITVGSAPIIHFSSCYLSSRVYSALRLQLHAINREQPPGGVGHPAHLPDGGAFSNQRDAAQPDGPAAATPAAAATRSRSPPPSLSGSASFTPFSGAGHRLG